MSAIRGAHPYALAASSPLRRPARLAFALLLGLTMVEARASSASAQSGHSWRAGDRVLVTRFAEVGAVAADLRFVYAASELGLERYDYVGRRWLEAVTVLDGYPVMERPTALASDPGGDALWLATSLGGLYTFEITFGRWRRVPVSAPGPVSALVPASDGIWLFASPDWLHLRSGSLFADAVPTAQVPPAVRAQAGSALERAARTDPFLASTLGSLALGDRLRHFPITSAAPGERPGSWWLGTWGGNLLRFDGHSGDAERLEFGLVSAGVSALATDGREIWFGGDGRGRWTGLTRASADLARWRGWTADIDGAPAAPVLAIVQTAGAVWFAAEDGLYRLDRRTERILHIDERDGLPSGRVEALAPAGPGVWAGTRAGLALVDSGGRVLSRNFAGTAIHHLSLAGDTLWVSGDAGLLMVPGVSRALPRRPAGPGDSAVSAADSLQRSPAGGAGTATALRGRVIAALSSAGTVWALASDAVWRRDPQAGWLPVRDPTLATVGRPVALASDDDAIWVAGATGIARYDARVRSWRSWTVGPDLPAGPVRAVLPLGDAVWAATPAGAVRIPLHF